MFTNECKVWIRLPRNLRTWYKFKVDFTETYTDLEDATATIRTTGFQSNFLQQDTIYQDTVTSIENLVNARVTDRKTIAQLTKTISNLTVDRAEANTKLVKALVDNATLTTKLFDRRTIIPRLHSKKCNLYPLLLDTWHHFVTLQ